MEEVNNENKEREENSLTLVVRKPCFGLPTACSSCLPVYFYLKFAQIPFLLDFNSAYPDSGNSSLSLSLHVSFLVLIEVLLIRNSGLFCL